MRNDWLVVAIFILICGCSAKTVGVPPRIFNLHAPTSINAGGSEDASFDFEDPDGDVANFGMKFKFSRGGGANFWKKIYPEKNLGDKKTGTKRFVVRTKPTFPQMIQVTVWLIDQEGNESNDLSFYVYAY
jgi:hypothetical protein